MPTNKKETSKRVASIASDILRDKRYSDKSKSAAGSALAQTPGSKKKVNSSLPSEQEKSCSIFRNISLL